MLCEMLSLRISIKSNALGNTTSSGKMVAPSKLEMMHHRQPIMNNQTKMTMITQTMVQPSSWIEDGIKLQNTRGLNLFKFTDELQIRLETLIDRQKSNLLTSEETAELAGITELDRIFTLMNARIIAES
jgi:hypothetical protein